MPWTRKHLIGIEELNRDEIETILGTAATIRHFLDRGAKKLGALRGKTVVNLFLEPSTRTRLAFETAAKRLGADVVSFDAAHSSTTKGETLRDTAQNIQALGVDMMVVRHAAAGAPVSYTHLTLPTKRIV